MRRITLLLIVMASTLVVASGVAWAATKTCPPAPKKCLGTTGADVLKSTSQDNVMLGGPGNDTYTHFVRGNSGVDLIADAGGRDTLVLANYSARELTFSFQDVNKNGKIDSLQIEMPKPSLSEAVLILDNFADTKSKCSTVQSCGRGSGYIELFQLR
jgi:Ca2+-binding RTX toxin-like protein